MNILENPRYEKKFVVPHSSMVTCVGLIRSLPQSFKKTYSARQVNNIYFDTRELACLYDTIDGEANRFKVRARWYGDFFGKCCPQLEIKSKRNLTGFKTVFELSEKNIVPQGLHSISFSGLCQSNIPADLNSKFMNYIPTLANSYRREYYMSSSNSLRLTIDSDLKWLPLRYKNSMPQLFSSTPDIRIIEVKFEPLALEEFSVVANLLPFRIARFSKYLTGMQKDVTLKIQNVV